MFQCKCQKNTIKPHFWISHRRGILNGICFAMEYNGTNHKLTVNQFIITLKCVGQVFGEPYVSHWNDVEIVLPPLFFFLFLFFNCQSRPISCTYFDNRILNQVCCFLGKLAWKEVFCYKTRPSNQLKMELWPSLEHGWLVIAQLRVRTAWKKTYEITHV